ncbi:MAG: hypothetical protein NVSMB65_10700 [Chloroflexota bacterium]
MGRAGTQGEARRDRSKARDPDAATLRRVGWRLAALTVALLCVLLLALGTGIYVITQQALFQSLQTTLEAGAHTPPRYIRALYETGMRAPGRIFSGPAPDTQGLFYVAADADLAILGGNGPRGHLFLDRAAAQAALHAGVQCCVQQRYAGQDYLTYSIAALTPDGQVLGVVQASIPEAQYEATLRALLRVIVLVSGLGLLASGAISAALARRALQPIGAALRHQRDFVADAAHELRTPLAIQRTAVELGLATDTLTEGQAALEQSLIQNGHLTRLVDALSLLARTDSGVLTLERQPLDLARLVVATAGDAEILAEERGIALRVDAEAEAQVVGDAGRLRQLLLILLDNALKYTPSGGAIAVRVERQGNRVQVQVRDTGPGIDAVDLPHVFDRFYRANRARSGEGTGLGLAIGRWIAEAHGGTITAANAADRGALFTVALPLLRP